MQQDARVVGLTLGAIVDALGGSLEGADRDTQVQRIAPLDTAAEGELSFLHNPRYAAQLSASRAACVIVAPALRSEALARGGAIVTDDPYLYFARATQLWARAHGLGVQPGVHASAVVDPGAQIHPTAHIGPLCVIERGAVVGAHTRLASRVSVGARCRIGARCIVHPGVVIGADGFGFAPHQGMWEKIEQLGAVVIGDDVEIGANTCIDRGALGDTVIEDGVKLDNLIQIAHNVRIGRHTAMAGCSAVAGSTQIGAHCTIAGAASIVGHLRIADRVHISTNTVVTHSIHRSGHYTGVFPMDDNARWEKNAATLRQLYRLRERVKALEQRLQDGSKPQPQ